jgi:hypothetical protein
MRKERILSLQNKAKTFQEVSFYRVLLFQVIKQAVPQQIELIKVELV